MRSCSASSSRDSCHFPSRPLSQCPVEFHYAVLFNLVSETSSFVVSAEGWRNYNDRGSGTDFTASRSWTNLSWRLPWHDTRQLCHGDCTCAMSMRRNGHRFTIFLQISYHWFIWQQNVSRQFHLERTWISTVPWTAEWRALCEALYLEDSASRAMFILRVLDRLCHTVATSLIDVSFRFSVYINVTFRNLSIIRNEMVKMVRKWYLLDF
jgi:hypothetical protein